jgi:hypothetical protein
MAAVVRDVLPQLHNDVHDLLIMLGILVAFVVPAVVTRIRHACWRRRVLAAFR